MPADTALVTQDGARVKRRAFFDQDVLEQEIERIFKPSWQFVAHESEVKAPGDYVTRMLGLDPVIVTRSKGGEISVLFNSCTHRGRQLCGADSGKASHFVCGYHGWNFANTGELRGVPQRAELYAKGFDRSAYGLKRARVEIVYGLIFATFDQTVPSLADNLGDMDAYLKAALGKCDMEVVGAPTRRLGVHNWKTGVENWTGDGYHNAITHRSVDELDMLDAQRTMNQASEAGASDPVWEDTGSKVRICQYTTANGHAGKVTQLAADYDQPVYFGYEPHLWPAFTQRLGAQQADLASRTFQLMGTVFPNFSFTQLTLGYLGDDTPPVAMVNIRVWRPVSANQTETIMWVLVPRDASAQWKRHSQRAFVRSIGPAGLLDVDDMQNWAAMAQSNQGPVGLDDFHDYSGKPEQPADQTRFPGDIYPGELHDVVFRTLYREWSRRMEEA